MAIFNSYFDITRGYLPHFRRLHIAPGVEAGACKALPFAHDDIEDLAKARQLKSYEELVTHAPGRSAMPR